MADSVVSFLLHKIDFLLSREWALLSGINDEIGGLKRELEAIGALLRDSDRRGESNEQVRVWIQQARDLAYDIEDVLDMYAFHIAQLSNQLPEFLQGLTRLKQRRFIAVLIREIKAKLHGVKLTRERYDGMSNTPVSSPIPGHQNHSYLHPRVAALYLDESEVVGIEEPRHKLSEWAVSGEAKLDVIFVVGMGGLGKTTLVRKVADKIKKNFDCFAWITISKSDKNEELLWTMLKRVFESTGKQVPSSFHTINQLQLMDKLRAYLRHKRFLIVLDDLWKKDVWESIKHALPTQNHGRIIITTRRGDIARICSHSSAQVHNLQPLPLDKARQLFYKKIFPSSGDCPAGLLAWSDMILERCKGLPLAIATLGTLLSHAERTTDAWKKLHDSLGAELHMNGRLSSTRSVLSICYDDLPYYLKYCFLYFSVFPEDYLVKRRRLIRLWVSEGLVKEVTGKTLEEVGEDYLSELIDRNLVHVNEVDFDGRPKTCCVHHLWHKIILSKSQEENFCRVSTDTEMIRDAKIRRLSIQRKFNCLSQKVFPCARSLFMFGMEAHFATQNILKSFCILKVLDLEGAPLDMFPQVICELLLLKYLSLRDTKIQKLPKSLGRLQNLETLDLKQTLVTQLHDNILRLEKLRHLLVDHRLTENFPSAEPIRGFKTSSNIGRLEALQKLLYIRAGKNGGSVIQALGNLTQLRKLGIVELAEEDGEHLIHSIEKMVNLRSLDVKSIEGEFLDLSVVSSPPPFLQRLYLNGHLQKVPDWVSSLHDLVRVRLMRSRLESNPITILQDLPNLMELQLLDAYNGTKLDFLPEKFQNLKILQLENLNKLELVVVGNNSLSSLEKLVISQCRKIKHVPEGISELASLKELNLNDMSEELVSGLERNGGQFMGLSNTSH
ncbi:disease resistance protein RPM1-like isoform X2 [Diospyros lotus]|uniref:disease resistance protein RPM1-like isoform X2 n=1 Tax=Diospyros lotus TaxID=55363 RepID=UPI00224CADD0|nr:disease resistance protein RPM1-like isoform X2 [Diospyros lotus]